jgi:hypothetical protein
MRTRLSILIVSVVLSGSAPLHAVPANATSVGPVSGWDFGIHRTVRRILRLVPKATGDRLSPPNPAPAPAPRCATADCRTK